MPITTLQEAHERAAKWFDAWKAKFDKAHPVEKKSIDFGDGIERPTALRVLEFGFASPARVAEAIAAGAPWVVVDDPELVAFERANWKPRPAEQMRDDDPSETNTVMVVLTIGPVPRL